MRTFIQILFVFALNPAWAVGPTITSVTGASASNLTGTATVIGGFAGDECTTSGNTDTCNNCTASTMTCSTATNGLCPCNTTRAYGTLLVRINITKPAGSTGQARISKGTATALNNGETNDGNYVTFTWDTLCQADADIGGATCNTITNNKTATYEIYIDTDGSNTKTTGDSDSTSVSLRIINPGTGDTYAIGSSSDGMYDFTPYPGDKKIYLEDPSTSSSFPTLGYGSKAVKVRIFRSTESLASATPESADNSDVDVVENGNTLSNNTVTGLDNGTTYVFRVGLIDEANNVVLFFPGVPAAAPDTDCDSKSTTDSNGSPFGSCPYKATPDEVLGLLTDDFNCFIATAAYGSAMEPKLKTFREFRQKILLPRTWGRKFVNFYYDFGPRAARVIYGHPGRQWVARMFLWPAYALAKLSLRLGWWQALTLVLLMISGFVIAFRQLSRRRFGHN
ncbi:MAG: CFI-box-CTERM domain-containing protein [Bdellovibrionales bacterium]